MQAKENEMLKSTVVIIFGVKGENPLNTFGVLPGGQDGTGVVVNNKWTVETAKHAWLNRPADTDTVFIQTSDGKWHYYDYADVQVEELIGDAVKITLPSALSDDVVLARHDWDYDYSKPNQSVYVVYSRRKYDPDGVQTGYTLGLTTGTTADDPVQQITGWGYQLIIDTSVALQKGDSGGPVFSGNGLVGINSGTEDGTHVSVAPQCFGRLSYDVFGPYWAQPC